MTAPGSSIPIAGLFPWHGPGSEGSPLTIDITSPAAAAHWMRRLAPSIPRGLIADRTEAKGDAADLSAWQRFALRHLLAFPSVGAAFVAYDVKALPAPAPGFLRNVLRVPVLTWTVRTPENRATARRHADQMIFEGFDPEA